MAMIRKKSGAPPSPPMSRGSSITYEYSLIDLQRGAGRRGVCGGRGGVQDTGRGREEGEGVRG